ncbi:methyltransferase domain-containing protein [Salinimicrobium flavum]|uniref:Methyltransferase domain-containing protein n=1 Tax=Salinimicrobium flavum TaxID=1737065 RepID=A0ABW5IZG6_9FLAO
MKNIDTRKRSTRHEIMDDFDLQGPELEKTLKDLDKVNKWLGGNKLTLEGIEQVLENYTLERPVKIVDVGCGNGSVLMEVAQLGRRKKIPMELVGIDGNRHTIAIAQRLNEYPEISFQSTDVFSRNFKNEEADIFLCTLTLHHFKDDEIEDLLRIFVKNSSMGVVINDLHRSRIAYYLFEAFCAVFIKNEIARRDGLISILRGFKEDELEWFGRNLKVRAQKIKWKWAFRYQWILFK